MGATVTQGMGHPLGYGVAAFTSVAGLEFSAAGMFEGTPWRLTLSPPDPNAGTWWGTIGPGGTVIWPTPIDPNPPSGGGCLDDQFPSPLVPGHAGGFLSATQLDTGTFSLPPGDTLPITI